VKLPIDSPSITFITLQFTEEGLLAGASVGDVVGLSGSVRDWTRGLGCGWSLDRGKMQER
jgi:hypothetical protein